MEELVLKIENLKLNAGGQELFRNFNLEIHKQDIIGFFAPTGTGKTSLFNYIARNNTCSYVFQEPRLIPSVSVLKNVMLPLENKMDKAEAKATAAAWLEKLNMGHKIDDYARTLSGGEQQRTSIARAFSYLSMVEESAQLLLLDEPFASQDEKNISNIITLTKQLVSSKGCACLVISHDRSLLESFCTRIITQDMFVL